MTTRDPQPGPSPGGALFAAIAGFFRPYLEQKAPPGTGAFAVQERPCRSCPWWRANWGRTGTGQDDYYTVRRRRTMWSGGDEGLPLGTEQRNGFAMLCHLADEGAREDVRQCAASIVLKEREVLRYHRSGDLDKSAMSARGLRKAASEMLGRHVDLPTLREVPLDVLLKRATPLIADDGLGHDGCAPLSGDEALRWRREGSRS